MSTINVRLPDSIHRNARRLAKRDGCSLNQLIASAVGEKIAALETESCLEDRAKKGRKVDISDVLAKVPRVKPDRRDRLK